MFKIAPSILSCDFAKLGDEIRAVEKAGADIIHIDVMDGHFVPNLTIGPAVIESIKKVTKLPLDVHLMIDNPDRHIDSYVKAGADMLSVHPEVCLHLNRTLESIRKAGIKAAVALNPATPLYLLDHVWDYLDMVLVMSVNPGFGGQKFIPESANKIQNLRKKSQRHNPGLDIEVDGGINLETVKTAKDAGANIFVAGQAIFKSPNYRETIAKMREIVKG